MSMIQFPSDHKDAKNGNTHVAGSQSKANKQCAQNMREGAINFRVAKTKGETTGRVVQEGTKFNERRLMLTAHTGAVHRVGGKRRPVLNVTGWLLIAAVGAMVLAVVTMTGGL